MKVMLRYHLNPAVSSLCSPFTAHAVTEDDE